MYRFFTNQFKLKGLTLLNNFEGKNFNDVHIDTKSEFTEVTLLVTIFKDFPGTEFELEIFNRYNKGTKPLTPQEIRHAVYNSPFNEFVNKFTVGLYNDKGLVDRELFTLIILQKIGYKRNRCKRGFL